VLEQRIGTAGPGVGATSQPPVDATRLDLSASQFIDDMEDKAEVPDRWASQILDPGFHLGKEWHTVQGKGA
jgi:hypothetical protein